MEYDEYITSDHIKEMRARMYGDKSARFCVAFVMPYITQIPGDGC